MKVQIIQDQDKAGKKQARKQEIEQGIIQPLNTMYFKLDDMRITIKRLKEERDRLKDNLKNVDENDMPEEDIEEYEI